MNRVTKHWPERGGMRQFMIALAITGLSVALGSCSDVPTREGENTAPAADIAAAFSIQNPTRALGAGHDGFHFLPPLVTGPPQSAEPLDAALLPHLAVEVCAWTGDACGAVVSRMTAAGSGAGALRILGGPDGGRFSVNWQAQGLAAGHEYRLRVVLLDLELGALPVYAASPGRGRGITPPAGAFVVNPGQTVPVTFHVAEGTAWAVTPDGGTVATSDGAVSLVIPAGALAEPVAITVTPVEDLPPHRRRATGTAWLLEPAGLEFHEPATLTIRYDPDLLEDPGIEPFLWLHKQTDDGWVSVPGRPVQTEARMVTGFINGFSVAEVIASELEPLLREFPELLEALQLDPTAENALAAIDVAIAILIPVPLPEYFHLAEPFIKASHAVICAELNVHAAHARAQTTDRFKRLNEVLRPLVYWAALAIEGGAEECTPFETFLDVTDEKFSELVAGFLLASSADVTITFPDLVSDLPSADSLLTDLELFGLGALADRAIQEVIHPLYRLLRGRAYTACRVDGIHELLRILYVDVFAGGRADFDEADILMDLQYCGTSIEWELADEEGAVISAGGLGGGEGPGSQVETVQIRTEPVGRLSIGGSIRAVQCPDGTHGDDELIVRFRGSTIRSNTHSTGDLLADPLVLDLAELLADAGVDPAATGEHRLEIARVSTDCDGLLPFHPEGPPFVLATITIALDRLVLTLSARPESDGEFGQTIQLNAGGAAELRIELLRGGMPLVGRSIALELEGFGVIFPTELETDDNGVALASYWAPEGDAGEARVTARLDGATFALEGSVLIRYSAAAGPAAEIIPLIHRSDIVASASVRRNNVTLARDRYVDETADYGPFSAAAAVQVSVDPLGVESGGSGSASASIEATVAFDLQHGSLREWRGQLAAAGSAMLDTEAPVYRASGVANLGSRVTFEVRGGAVDLSLVATCSGSGLQFELNSVNPEILFQTLDNIFEIDIGHDLVGCDDIRHVVTIGPGFYAMRISGGTGASAHSFLEDRPDLLSDQQSAGLMFTVTLTPATAGAQ